MCVLWLLGLSGSGKSTLGYLLYEKLSNGMLTYEGISSWKLLDGDVLRSFLGQDIGYGFADRRRSVKVMGLVAKELSEAGIGVVVANISPFYDLRRFMREHISGYHEIYCKTNIETCIQRDPKGHYARQFEHGICDFVGLDIPFQEPANPDLRIETGSRTISECFGDIEAYFLKIGGRKHD